MWGIERPRPRGLALDERGEAMISFGFLLPFLLLVSLGTLEFALAAFDFHRAGEATRRAVRVAIIGDAVVLAADFTRGSTVTCTGSGGGVSCGGAGIGSADTFTAMLDAMRAIFPEIAAENVQVTYSDSGLGDPDTPGGIIPIVTVQLVNFQRNFLMLSGLPAMPDGYTMPDFEASQMGAGMGPASS